MLNAETVLLRGVTGLSILAALTLGVGCGAPVASSAQAFAVGTPAPALEVRAAPQGHAEPSWPGLFGPDGDSVSRQGAVAMDWGEAGPAVAWRRPLGLGYSAPVVLGHRLVLFYRQGDEEVVECADADSGETCWTFRYPTAYQSPVNYSSGPYSTPLLDKAASSRSGTDPAPAADSAAAGQTRVYAWGAEGRLHCLGLDRGTLCWSRSLLDDYPVEPGLFPVASSPLLAGERLIVNLGAGAAGAGVVALDKHTGQTLWTATQDGPSCATPKAATIHGRPYVFVWTAQHLTALDPASGRVWWQIPFSANIPEKIHATSPLVSGDVVLASGYHLGCLCVRVLPDEQYEELWRGGPSVLDSHYNNLICQAGCVFGFGTVGGGLRCVDVADGRLRWTWKSRLRNAASIAAGDQLILFDERGRLASVRVTPEGCEPIAVMQRGLLAGRCFSAPALSDGRLYLRNEEELVCVDLRRTGGSAPIAAEISPH